MSTTRRASDRSAISQPWPQTPKPVTSVTACTARPEGHERLGGGPVQPSHARRSRLRLSPSVPAGQHDAGADRLGQHEHVAGPGARLRQDAVGVDEALHGEPEDRLLAADGVAAGHHAAGLAHDLRGGDRIAAMASCGRRSGKAEMFSAITTRPPMANTSLQALAAAMAPKSAGSSTSGGKKSVVDTMARSSLTR